MSINASDLKFSRLDRGVDVVTKKAEFVDSFEQVVRKHPRHYRETENYLGFVKILDYHPDLRALFKEAVEEAREAEENEATFGLGGLFAGCE